MSERSIFINGELLDFAKVSEELRVVVEDYKSETGATAASVTFFGPMIRIFAVGESSSMVAPYPEITVPNARVVVNGQPTEVRDIEDEDAMNAIRVFCSEHYVLPREICGLTDEEVEYAIEVGVMRREDVNSEIVYLVGDGTEPVTIANYVDRMRRFSEQRQAIDRITGMLGQREDDCE